MRGTEEAQIPKYPIPLASNGTVRLFEKSIAGFFRVPTDSGNHHPQGQESWCITRIPPTPITQREPNRPFIQVKPSINGRKDGLHQRAVRAA
jgi:hypothetical protein